MGGVYSYKQKQVQWMAHNSKVFGDTQEYNHGNWELWLPKPEFTSYKMPNKTTIPKGGHSRRRATTKNSMQKGKKSKQRYSKWSNPSNLHQPKANSLFVKTWIPKDKLAQVVTTIGSKLCQNSVNKK